PTTLGSRNQRNTNSPSRPATTIVSETHSTASGTGGHDGRKNRSDRASPVIVGVSGRLPAAYVTDRIAASRQPGRRVGRRGGARRRACGRVRALALAGRGPRGRRATVEHQCAVRKRDRDVLAIEGSLQPPQVLASHAPLLERLCLEAGTDHHRRV